jgi:hypothetical protein
MNLTLLSLLETEGNHPLLGRVLADDPHVTFGHKLTSKKGSFRVVNNISQASLESGSYGDYNYFIPFCMHDIFHND